MSAWIPVIGALIGVLIGGGVSLLGIWLSGRNQSRLSNAKIIEERSIWAAERKLDRLQSLFAAVNRLGDAAQQMRIWAAWRRSSLEDETHGQHASVPDWVLSGNDARAGIESALHTAYLEFSLADNDLLEQLDEVRSIFYRGYMMSSSGDAIEKLVALEEASSKLLAAVAHRYRQTVAERASGRDVVGVPEVKA